jgi:Domain of unknown function (DUF1990)
VPTRPSVTRRWLTAATWPLGVTLTSWDYMWRSTPLHRSERSDARAPEPLVLPEGVSREDVQGPDDGYGPLFHRCYRTRIADPAISGLELMGKVQANPNRPAPSFARFQKVLGDGGTMAVGDEFVVRMPGPWDGPVRVIEVNADSFRLATLDGHLEAGQICFRVRDVEAHELTFEIESWARSSTRVTHVLYHTLRMSKEVQAHMWISFLEGVTHLAKGRMRGGVTIETERFEVAPNGR